jgi:hypothetical protein
MGIWTRVRNRVFPPLPGTGKIDLGDQLQGFYGQHRSGWPFVLKLLSRLHNPNGIYLDSFIERTFCWHPQGARANLRPWIGFIHIPPHVPLWFQYGQSNDFIFESKLWEKSLPYCRGLYALSEYHRRALEKRLDLPLNSLILPTETPALKWTWDRFAANREKKIIQVGWWLRKLHAIFMLPTRTYKKIFLRVTHTDLDELLHRERDILRRSGEFQDWMYDTAEQIIFVSNAAYDRLLAENIVIIHLYDSSANNTLIECMVRHTPILVNPIEPVVECLGADYPLYFTSLEEAAAKAESPQVLWQAHQYLSQLPDKHKRDGEYFMHTFVNSEIYKNL